MDTMTAKVPIDAGNDRRHQDDCSCRTCQRRAHLRGDGPRVDGFDHAATGEQPRHDDGRFRSIEDWPS